MNLPTAYRVVVTGGKSHSHDETQLPNFSSDLPHGPLTFQGSIGRSLAQWDPGLTV